jgi:large subunit ribosomal protein L17
MRHRKNFNHLGRKTGHRRAMLSNMASSLIIHKRIKTTLAKAKALRMYVEPLITKTKGLTSVPEKTHAQRVVFSYLQDKNAVNELFVEVAPKIDSRDGGYTRIIKLGNRLGDNAEMCFIELVDFNETMLASQDEGKKGSTRRRRRRGGSKSEGDETVAAKKESPKAPQAKEADNQVKDAAPEKSVEEVQANNTEATETVKEEELKAADASAEGSTAPTNEHGEGEDKKGEGESSKE